MNNINISITDFLSGEFNVTYNTIVAKKFRSVDMAIFINELIRESTLAKEAFLYSSKKKDNISYDGFFTVKKSKIENRTGISLAYQKKFIDILVSYGIIEQNNVGDFKINCDALFEISTTEVDVAKSLKDIRVEVKKEKIGKNGDEKQKAIINNVLYSAGIINTNPLYLYFFNWLIARNSKENTSKEIASAVAELASCTNNNIDLSIQILQKAAIQRSKTITSAITSYRMEQNNKKYLTNTASSGRIETSHEAMLASGLQADGTWSAIS